MEAKTADTQDPSQPLNKRLDGTVALVTGASSGIGEATARELAGRGAAVALLARRADRVQAVADELTAGGATALAIRADVTDEAALRRAAEQAAELGRVDLLVNNAGQMLLSHFADGLADEWRRMIEVNLVGAMTATDVFLPALRDGGGDVVNVSSVAGRKARPTTAVYSATKWGLGGWSEALRQELLGDGVRVILVEPGSTRTELATHISVDAVREGSLARYDKLDALLPQDIAEAIGFAVSRPMRVSVNEILIRPTLQDN
jgi:NADP-dependent 3-hydroxy acid dehydrogenase YdfG